MKEASWKKKSIEVWVTQNRNKSGNSKKRGLQMKDTNKRAHRNIIKMF
jgi:hypothetical protein